MVKLMILFLLVSQVYGDDTVGDKYRVFTKLPYFLSKICAIFSANIFLRTFANDAQFLLRNLRKNESIAQNVNFYAKYVVAK